MKQVLIGTILFLFSAVSFSQNIKIKGKLVDEENKSVNYANVVLLNADSIFITGTVSDKNGNFSFQKQEKTSYILSVSLIGYTPITLRLHNLQENLDLGTLYLSPDIVALEEVTIKGTNMVSRIDRQILYPTNEQIKKSINGLDLTQQLAIGGLLVDPIRKDISLLKNGNLQIRINGASASVQDVLSLSPTDIKRVEYHDNPSLRYGENVEGVIDYITTKRTSGGNIGGSVYQTLTTNLGADQIYAKYNKGKSQFGVSYYINFHNYTDFWRDGEERFISPDGEYTYRTEQGTPERTEEYYHILSSTYNYVDDNFLFQANLKMNVKNRPTDRFTSLMTVNEKQFKKQDNNTSLYTTPILDLYFYKKLKDNQSLAIDVVGTYKHTKNTHFYKEYDGDEIFTQINSDVKGRHYSIIGEGFYENRFEKGTLTVGASHKQSWTYNDYAGNYTSKTELTNANTYLYGEYAGKVNDFAYTVGIGMSRLSVSQEGYDTYTHVYLRPKLSLRYQFNKTFNARLRYKLISHAPELAELSDVEQAIDSLQINKGNPNLNSYIQHELSLDFNLNLAAIKCGLSFNYDYYTNPIMIETNYNSERKLYMQIYKNQHYLQQLNSSFYLSFPVIKNHLSLVASIGYNHFISKGNDYKHHYNQLYYIAQAIGNYKNFTLSAVLYQRENVFWGETVTPKDYYHQIDLSYRLKKCNIGIGIMNPFMKTYSMTEKNYSAMTPYHYQSNFKQLTKCIFVTFSFNLDFGHNYKSPSKEINNSDTDTGILDSRR